MTSRTEITIFLCGDVMTGRGVDQILPHPSRPRIYEQFMTSAIDYVALAERLHGPIPRAVDFTYVWGVAPEELRRARPDVRIINLETSVTTSESAAPKLINYRMHPGNVPVLTAAGIDCCVLANNHVLDWSTAGLIETLGTLERAGIRTAGSGRDLAAAQAPAVLDVDGEHRVLVFSFGSTDSGIPEEWGAAATMPRVHIIPDFSDATIDQIARIVDGAKRPGDIAVASVHWGANWVFEIPRYHQRFAHALIDRARIDVVHGHSSHHPMAIEVHRGRPVFYGCGDFLNDYEGITGHERTWGDLVLMYFPTLDAGTGELLRLTMTPLRINRFRLEYPTDRDRIWIRDTLDQECREFGHRVTLRDDALDLVWK